jgi:hypothetical protein
MDSLRLKRMICCAGARSLNRRSSAGATSACRNGMRCEAGEYFSPHMECVVKANIILLMMTAHDDCGRVGFGVGKEERS